MSDIVPRTPTTVEKLHADQVAWLAAARDRRAVARSRRVRLLAATVGSASTVLAIAAVLFARFGNVDAAVACGVFAVVPCGAVAVYLAVTRQDPAEQEPPPVAEPATGPLPQYVAGSAVGSRVHYGAAWRDQPQLRPGERGLPPGRHRASIDPPR